MIVIGIFLAAEPRIYDRGIAWMLPLRHRAGFYRIAEHVGFTLRRLLFGRLVGMIFEGVFTWLMLTLGGVPMAALLGLVTGVLAFIPNIGAITSGVLMVAVGFSAGPHQGVYAIFVYFFVQNIDGYLVVPYIARRTVDLAPAVVLAMQLLMGALFGILGVLFADPILATLKVVLVDLSQQQAAKEGEAVRRSSPARRLLLRRLLLPAAAAASSPRRRARPCAPGRRRSASLSLGQPGGAGPSPKARLLRHGEAVFAAFLHLGSSPRRSRGRPGHQRTAAARHGSRCCRTPCRRRRSAHNRAARRRRGRSARPCRP